MSEVVYTWSGNECYYKNIDITRKVFVGDELKKSQSIYNIDTSENFGDCRVFNQDSLKFLFEKAKAKG